ncbi:hypothetical protein PsorP6_002756 [Peronosclerospora sorghi]|uniref:Uncharacterized protein n=1 Tax=Peronosclerospora sorghi TaxID=230839 RepID=A0ACC0VIA9_9STRA|nr:hypothetical protein PsorP6_002756 [Peronosclerospora sorghi]
MTSALDGRSDATLAAATFPSSLDCMDPVAIPALPNANKVLSFLHVVFGLCQQIRDRPRACLQVHARLHQAFLKMTDEAKHRSQCVNLQLQQYIVLLSQFKGILDQHLRLPNIVAKVTASRRLLSGLAKVHHDLNAFLVNTSLANANGALLEWKQQFVSNRGQDEKALHDALMSLLSTRTFLNKELSNERRQALVLVELVAEFASNDQPRRHSTQLLETLKMTHRRISNLCDLHIRRVPRWFLPGCEVDFSFSDHTIGLTRGSFGSTLQRGEAYRHQHKSDGAVQSARSTVAVKCLWPLADVHFQLVEQLFARSGMSKWIAVRHPNVVTVRGASHAATPPYLVRDFTTYGGLTSYLAALETRANECAGPESSGKVETLTWQLLYGASRGLLHLHEKHSIVHGGLRCNNILVDKKGRAVITDFGVYTLACDARDSGLTEFFNSNISDADDEEFIRWQAPECLREHIAYRQSLRSSSEKDSVLASSSASPSATKFATDVYAFGMCILEALTRSVPWAGLNTTKIRTLKQNLSLLPPRPRCISSQAWTLIEKMCAADPKKRISLSEASQKLKRLGYGSRVFIGSRSSSLEDLVKLETDAAAHVNCESSTSDGASQDEVDVNNPFETDTGSLKAQATAEFERISTSLNETSRVVDNISIHSRNATLELRNRRQTSKNLVCVSKLLDVTAQELKRTSKLSIPSAGETAVRYAVLDPVEKNIVEELNTSAINKQIHEKVSGFSALDNALTVKQTGRSLKKSAVARKQQYSKQLKAVGKCSSELAAKQNNNVQRLNFGEVNHLVEVSGLSNGAIMEEHNIRELSNIQLNRSNRDSTSSNDRVELNSASYFNSNSFANEQPEQEIDYDTTSVVTDLDNDTYSVLSSDEEDGDFKELIIGDNSVEEDALTIVPAEFATARSFDKEHPPSLQHPVISLLESLRKEDSEKAHFVETLEAMKEALDLSTASIIVKREGLITFMEIVWRDYSEACTINALGLLQSIAGLSSEFEAILLESKGVKVLLALLKHRSAPQQVDLAASFLLELAARNDEAKRELWKCRGVGVLEDNLFIDRRLVQEVKSTMAKFKRTEGLKCLEDGEFHLAIDNFTEAIALDRKRAGYYADRSLAYSEASMFKQAVDDAYRCIRYNPYDAMGYLRHGLALKSMGKYAEAIQSLLKGLEVDPKFVKIREALKETDKLYKARLKGGDSATLLRRMTAAEMAKLKKKDGDDALRKKDFALAIECYSEALELDSKNDWLYLHRSIAYAAQKNHSKAIEDASKCIRINYRQIEGYYRLALALHGAGQHDEALSTLYRGEEIEPRHAGIIRFIKQLEEKEAKEAGLSLPEWFKERGYRAFQLRSYETAVKFYTKAIDASPFDDDEVVMHSYMYRSRANQTRGELAAVVADCTYILERRPKNVFARLRRADAYEQQRDILMALEDIRELVACNPEYKDAHARLLSLEHRCRLLPGASQRNL